MFSIDPSRKPASLTEKEFEATLRQGITAAKGGSRSVARRLFNQAAMLNPIDARPWIWLSSTTDDPWEQREFLEKALSIEPSNEAARKGLALLTQKFGTPEEKPGFLEPQSTSPNETDIQEASVKSFICPKCGGRMSHDIDQTNLVCEFCGHHIYTPKNLAADTAEQFFHPAMHTRQAHSWAGAQHEVKCEKCGALSLLAPRQRTTQCPYCGSNQLVDSKELKELIDPQVIALIKVDESSALKLARKWLGRGIFAPDDLMVSSKKLNLRPGYYPFWTFDGTVEVNWSCQVNESYNRRYNQWVYRNGSQHKFFDDVLVSAVSALDEKEVRSIEPFNLKDVVTFDPKHLAGWSALSYDRSMAAASLLAREKVMKIFRRELSYLIEPGQEKRDLQVGGGNWTGMTYKHVLLPVYVGTYQYKGKEYHVLVNGQTGKVGGVKPKDSFKIVGIGIMISVFLVLWIILLAWILARLGVMVP